MAAITQDVNINFNDGGANKSIDELKKKLNDIVVAATLQLDLDTTEAESNISKFRSQLASIIAEPVNLDVTIGGESISELKSDVDSLENKEINLDVTVNDENLPEIQNQLDSLEDKSLIVDVAINDGGIQDIKSNIDSLEGKEVPIDIVVPNNPIPELKSDVDSLENKEVNIDVSVNGEEIPELKADLSSIITEPVNIDVTVNDESIPELKSEIESIQPEPVNIDVEVNDESIPELKQQIDSIDPEPIKLDVKTDKSKIDALISSLGNVKAEAEALGEEEVDVNINDNIPEVTEKVLKLSDEIKGIQGLDNKIDFIINASESAASIEDLKQQLKELENVAVQAGEKNPQAFIRAQQEAGKLKDRIGDIRDGVKTFSAGDPVEGLSKGFGNLKNKLVDLDFTGFVEETERLRILSTQLSFASFSKSIGDVVKGFGNLTKVLLSNPLFWLAAAIGLIIANFEWLMSTIDGVTKLQEESLELSKKQLAAEELKLKNLLLQENSLRLQGVSEAEILRLKIAAAEEARKAAEDAYNDQVEIAALQEEASIRNKQILSDILDAVSWLNIPLKILMVTIDEVAELFGKDFDSSEAISNLLFDPKEVAKKGEETIKAADEKQKELKNQEDGYRLQLKNERKKAGDERVAQTKEETDAVLEVEMLYQSKLLSVRQNELRELDAYYADRKKKLDEAFKGGGNESEKQEAQLKLDQAYYAERTKIIASYVEESEKKTKDLQDFIYNNTPLTNEQARQNELVKIAEEYAEKKRLAEKNVTEQLELLKILQDETKRLLEEGAPDEKIQENAIDISAQEDNIKQANQVLLDLNQQRIDKTEEQNQEFRDEDLRAQLEANLLSIQNESKLIQNSLANSNLKIRLLQDEYDAAKLLREQDQADAIEKAAGNVDQIAQINANFRAQDLAATQEFLQSKSAIFEQELQKNMAAAEGVAAALNQIGDSAGSVFGGVNTLVGNLTTGFVGLKGSFADLKTNLADIDAQVESGAITAEEGSRARFEAYGAAISATLGVVSDAVNQVGQILAEQSQQKIDEINNVRDTQIAASQEATEAQIADLDKQKAEGAITEAEYQAALESIKKKSDKKLADINAIADKKELAAKKKAFKQNKAIQITNATIATAQGVISAFQLGPIAGAIAAVLIGALGAAQIATISSQKFPEEGSDSGGGGSPSIPDVAGDIEEGSSESQSPSPIDIPGLFAAGQTRPSEGTGQPIIIENNIVETDITRVQNDVNVIETRATIT